MSQLIKALNTKDFVGFHGLLRFTAPGSLNIKYVTEVLWHGLIWGPQTLKTFEIWPDFLILYNLPANVLSIGWPCLVYCRLWSVIAWTEGATAWNACALTMRNSWNFWPCCGQSCSRYCPLCVWTFTCWHCCSGACRSNLYTSMDMKMCHNNYNKNKASSNFSNLEQCIIYYNDDCVHAWFLRFLKINMS